MILRCCFVAIDERRTIERDAAMEAVEIEIVETVVVVVVVKKKMIGWVAEGLTVVGIDEPVFVHVESILLLPSNAVAEERLLPIALILVDFDPCRLYKRHKAHLDLKKKMKEEINFFLK